MPVQVSYPGVYIEEIRSSVRTIASVATSITAFLGWAPQGPTDAAYKINSWSDYERLFGGLNRDSDMSYAVSQFFGNGGSQAYIVRLTDSDPTQSVAAQATLAGLDFEATGAGEWANGYKAMVTRRKNSDGSLMDRFRLEIKRGNTTFEIFENLSMDSADERYIESVINDENGGSQIVNIVGVDKTKIPDDKAEVEIKGGKDKAIKPADPVFWTSLWTGTAAVVAPAKPAIPGRIQHLVRVDLFNLLCVPGFTDATKLNQLEKFARDHRAMLITDCEEGENYSGLKDGPNTNLTGADGINAAFYFPWLKAPDPLLQGRLREFPPCGFVAGIYARTDAERGVWKAPAGIDASLSGVAGVKTVVTDLENGDLNSTATNCIRNFPVYGTVVWGARTLRGNNQVGSEWKYIPVRRTALFIEESLYRGLKWVVFEPNDEPLWQSIRLNVGVFMHGLFRQGAFQGSSPKDAYFVKCDKDTTTQADINLGIVNIVVGFAPLKPAEFVVVKIQQLAGQLDV